MNAVAPAERGGVQSFFMRSRSAPLSGRLFLAAAAAVPAAAREPPAASSAFARSDPALLRRIREIQKDLKTARAKCEVISAYTMIDRTVCQSGTVCWRRDADGTIRQRWDLVRLKEDDAPATSTTILVAGDEIVYLENGAVTERGPLRAADLFHHPAFGGLVLTTPSDEALKDPELEWAVHPLTGDPGAGEKAAAAPPPPARAEAGEPAEAPPAPGGLYVMMRPRKAPWTGVLEDVSLTVEPRHGTILGAVYRENNRNEYTVRFSAVEANPELDEHLFDPPAR